MNDVLPKPFTKEGLLNMLEKHLGHLKKHPPQPPPGIDTTGGPPQPLAHSATRQSLKSEDSPATSPATVTNWQSPGNNLGVSPSASSLADESYMSNVPGQHGGHFGMQPGPSPRSVTFNGSPQAHLGPRQLPPGPPPHRRQISDISGGQVEMGPDIKRQQMYGPGPGNQIPLGQGPPMGQPMPGPMNPMQRPR